MADDNYPGEGELVIATVSKIQYHSIFCDLDEYPGRSGMLHISEIAPGRIRNVSDYVKEGKSVIAKVLRTDRNKGHIDLSIRRVTEAQRKQKSAERKHTKLVQNIIEQVAEQLGKEPQELRAQLEQAITDYELYDAFTQVVENEMSFTDFGLQKKTAKALEEFVKDRIKPQRVSIKGDFTINSYAHDGIARIRAAFGELPDNTEAFYRGAGVYSVEISAKEYKAAEEVLKAVKQQISTGLGDDAEIAFARTDKK